MRTRMSAHPDELDRPSFPAREVFRVQSGEALCQLSGPDAMVDILDLRRESQCKRWIAQKS